MHPTPAPTHRTRSRRRRTAARAGALALAAALLVPACGSDDDASSSTPTVETTAAKTTTSHDDHGKDAPAPTEVAEGTVTVHAVDFAYQQLPAKVKAGTTFELVNDAPEELHELVAIKLPDDEERSVDELIELPEAEFEQLFMAGPPAMVLLAKPGEPQIAAVGDGTLTEPGRYLVACSIPTGADPDELLESEGPPPADAGGAPHFHHGMYGEVTVV